MLILAVSWVAELNVQEFTVIPAPKLHVAPDWKLDPAKTTDKVLFCCPLFGVAEVSEGGGGGGAAVTVKAFAKLPDCGPGLVTVTVRDPVVALKAIEILAVSCVLPSNVQEVTVIPEPKSQVAPLRNAFPVIVALRVCPWLALAGAMLDTVGGVGAFTVRAVFKVALWLSGLVTLRARKPVGAVAGIVIFAVS